VARDRLSCRLQRLFLITDIEGCFDAIPSRSRDDRRGTEHDCGPDRDASTNLQPGRIGDGRSDR
jgi:hypothetical protein